MESNVFNELNKMDTPIEYENDTDLELEELLNMTWKLAGTEESKYSRMVATTYIDETGTYAKKVFSDGFVEFYEIA